MRRALILSGWTLGALLALCVLLVAALLVAGNTDSGRALIVRLTTRLTHGEVQLSGIHGSFPAALDLDRLQLSDERGVWLFAEHIALRWSPMALLVRHVEVQSLRVARLHIERAPIPKKESKPHGAPSIPRSDFAELSVDSLELGPALAGTAVSLVVHGSAHLRSLQDATAHIVAQRSGGFGDYELQLRFDPRRMDATLRLQEPAHGPLESLLKTPGLGDLDVQADVHGPRNAENVLVSLAAGSLHGRLQGSVDLTSSSADLRYSLTAPAMRPYSGLAWRSIDLQGRWRGTLQSASADGHLRAAELETPGGTRLGALNADLRADKGLLTVRATVEGLVIPGPAPGLLEGAPLTLAASTRLADARRPMDLKATHRLFTLQAHAVMAGQQAAQLELRVPDIAPFAAVGGQSMRGNATIKARVTRDATSTRLTADANASLDGGNALWAELVRGDSTRLELAGELTERTIAIERLRLSGAAIALAASGTVTRTAAQELDTRLDLNLPDLARLSPALSGRLRLSGSVRGPRQSLSVAAESTTTLSVHGSPTGTLSATMRADGLPRTPRGSLDAHGDLDGAPLVLNVSAEQGSGGNLHVVVRHADWKSAHADGEVTSPADLTQARGQLRVRMSQLEDLDRVLGSNLRGGIAGNVVLTPAVGGSRARLQFEARDLTARGLTANVQLSGDGTLDALRLQLAAQSPAIGGAPLSVTSTALLHLKARDLQLASAEANYHEQTLRLLSPVRLAFANGFSIDDLRLGMQQAVLEVHGMISPALDVRASLRQVQPGLINAFVPGLLASGTIQGELQVQGSVTAPTGNVRIDATGLRAANDAARGLPTTDIHAAARLMGDTATVEAKLAAGNASGLALTGRAPLAAQGALDLKLTGNLDMGLLNPLLEARGRHVTGALTVDTTVTGNPAAPEIGGTVRLAKGSLRDYTQGTNLSDINGILSGSHGTLHIENLTARAAPGNISVTGAIGVLQPKIPVDLQLSANGAQPIANNIVTANIDADLRVHGTARERLDVEGKMYIRRANVEIPSSLPPNVAVLDVRRPGRAPPPVNEKPLVIGLNVTLDAPRQILVKGRGLDAELGGEIRIRGTTESPVVSGGFELQRGFFTLASSKLTFSNGSVTFNGAGLKQKIDPTLDFTAQSQVVDVTATVRITGLADAPNIELSSTPELPQDEILARLLFGVPASQLSALQVVQIGAALATLGGGGGGFNPVAKLQKALGLDRLSVGSGTTTGPTGAPQNTGASIEAGRYVSSRVFVAVKQSTTGVSQLAVDVDLTKHLKLQTRLGNGTTTAQGTTPDNDPGSSVGLAYQFEY